MPSVKPAPVQPDVDRWSLVIAGSWNPPIFTLEWVSAHILPGAEKLESETGILETGTIVQRISAIDIRMMVFPNKVELQPLAASRGALDRVERTAVQLLERLRDTPVTAFGINLGFDTEADAATSALAFADAEPLTKAGYAVQAINLQRRMLHDGHVINFGLIREGSLAVKLNVNHHFEARTTEQMLRVMRGSIPRAVESTKLLLAAYGLEFDAK